VRSSAAATVSPTAPPSHASTVRPIVVAVPGASSVQLQDVSFVGDEVWARAWRGCRGGTASCVTMLHSSDGGTNWSLAPSPSDAVVTPGCSTPCLYSIRFATPTTGYVFGPKALFMTIDGGAHWVRQPGGAAALETLDNNVLRVVAVPADCDPPGCRYTVESSAIGSTSWQPTGLDATSPGTSDHVALSRSGSMAVLTVFGHTAGGAGSAYSQLYISQDDGRSWTPRTDPCARLAGTEFDAAAVTAALDLSIAVICQQRDATSIDVPLVSTDRGASFRAGRALGDIPSLIAAASSSVIVVGDVGLYRTTDSGRSWRAELSDQQFRWLGFESDTVGHAVSEGGETFWTTTDAGATWTAVTFR
jgi:photosystem II stability/assembly factor-like uncharacterized protein